MSLGPYKIKNKSLSYPGNKLFKPLIRVDNVSPSNLSSRHLEVKKNVNRWNSLIRIWDGVFKGTNEFMKKKKVLFF